jgi:hypothetical protein
MVDEIKVHVVIALCEELGSLDSSGARHALVIDKLKNRWRALSSAEQDAVDQILGQRGLPAVQHTFGAPGSERDSG